MLGQCLLHGDTLVLSLPSRFLAFDGFVVSEVFDIFGVVVGFISLGLRR